MKKALLVFLLLTLISCSQTTPPLPKESGAGVASWSEQTPYDKPLAREEGLVVDVSARVKAVDLKKRTLTFVGEDGKEATIAVGPEIKRLNEVRPGDSILVQYYESLAFEVRKATPEEIKNPAVEVDFVGKTAPGETPAGGVGQVVHTIVKITAINRAAQTVTVKPLKGKPVKGKALTIHARDPKNLERVKVGDTVAVTFTQAIGISLEKARK